LFDIGNKKLIGNFARFPKKNIIFILFFLGFSEWFISDVINFSGGFFGFAILCTGGYFYLRNDKPKFNEPKDLNGWVKLCNDDLKYFDELEERNNVKQNNIIRKNKFNNIFNRNEPQKISIFTENKNIDNQLFLDRHLFNDKYELTIINELPPLNSSEILPDSLFNQDAIIFNLSLPLTAKGLLWLKRIPDDMPAWIAVSVPENSSYQHQLEALKLEVPNKFLNFIITCNQENVKNLHIPSSFRKFTHNANRNIENTKKRLLKDLHSKWQAEIETLRRVKLKEIQQKNQLLVAASVFASPIPSIDVLSMTVLNSLMLNEIKEIWGCNWSPEILEKVSKEIIKAAIAQGVIEWSGQAVIGISKIHGPNWLIAGSLQAISAAYLTRVVSRSLADFMAISKGVLEPDLEFIKNNCAKIVENAFQSEKINWKSLITDIQSPLKFKFN
tara:strand:+ start:263 stop:1591 length:1329 start_codon:yes stop_codon:yes gene_type:complete